MSGLQTSPRRLIVGISGATGIAYGVRLLERLRDLDVETHLVVSRTGDMTRAYETDVSAKALRELASVTYRCDDVGAAISSGSFKTMGMVVVPCSVKTLSEIAHGFGHTLLSRSADVVLKERRRLVLVVRETPLSLIHLKNMVAVTEAGGVIMPPVPAFYTHPESVDDIIDQTVGRVLDMFDLEAGHFKRWGEELTMRSGRASGQADEG